MPLQRRFESQIGRIQQASARPAWKPAIVVSLILWFMIWGGYNTIIEHVLSPGFPANGLDLLQGMRVFLPVLAGWVAILILLSGRSLKTQAVAGPLGLLGFYTMAGIISSIFLSPFPPDALCWAFEFGAVILVLMVVLNNQDAPQTLSRLMTFNWIIAICLLVAILAAIPFLGSAAISPTQGSPLGIIVYHGGVQANGSLLGMPTSRNTGLARYAGVAGVVALARLLKPVKPGKRVRIAWAAVLLLSLVTLVLAQARTETLSFVAGAALIMTLRKRRRVVLIGFGSLGAVLLGLVGFFNAAWSFGTRQQGFDPTLTGRTNIWAAAMKVIGQSPWLGFGFRADRYLVHADMQNSFLHALIQAGVLGAIAYVAAFGMAWYLVIRLYLSPQSGDLFDEVPAILMFFTVMSITETAAWYTADWLLLAPAFAYIQLFAWQGPVIRLRTGLSHLLCDSGLRALCVAAVIIVLPNRSS
jgi:O-antigen ligase